MRRQPRFWFTVPFVVLSLVTAAAPPALAGGPPFRRRSRVVETVAPAPSPRNQLAPTGMLGTFTPTPYVFVIDNGVIGQGRAPLGSYGFGNSLSVFGPLSEFRTTSAPVNTVVRGYDGVPVVIQGTSFSTPNLPRISPYVYPTRSSNYSALPFQGTDPRRDKGILWIDQN